MTTQTIKVTVAKLNDTDRRFFFDGQPAPRFTLLAGETYLFDQSDPSNKRHPMRLSLTADGTHMDGVEFQGGVKVSSPEPGQTGAGLTFAVPSGTPPLHFFCLNHHGLGGDGKLFVASSGNDILSGTSFADSIQGHSGNDLLSGLGGNDTLDGGAGNDTLVAGLAANASKTVWNEAVNGAFSMKESTPTPIMLEPGLNRLQASVGQGEVNRDFFTFTVEPGRSITSIRLASYASEDARGWIGLQSGNAWTAGNDIKMMLAQQHFGTANSGAGLLGISPASPLGPGTYTVRAQQLGATANYRLDFSMAVDSIPAGAASLSGGEGNDLLLGAAGNDTLDGGAGNDSLSGETGNDRLLGAAGNDSLSGGAGNDRLLGGAGKNTLDGGAGTDWADYAAVSSPLRIDLAKRTATASGITDRLDSIENVAGGSKNDLLIGNSSKNVFTGSAGNDSLHGIGGADSLDGGAGRDYLTASAGGATLRGGADNDILEIVEQRFEVVSGKFTWDQARGDAESRGGQLATIKDEAEWNAVRAVLNGQRAWLGASDDPLSISGAKEGAWKWIDGTPWTFTNWNGPEPSNTGGVEHHLEVRAESEQKWNDEKAATPLSSYILERNLPATTSPAASHLDGGDGNDLLRGSHGADNFLGGAGNDTLHGGTGSNTISGGAGNDILTSAGSLWQNNSYQAISGSFTFEQAMADAAKKGGHLATVGSVDEWEKIKTILPAGRAWLGASDARQERQWEWIDGTPWTFSNWNGPEPSNTAGAEHHLEVRSESDKRWNDERAATPLPFYILEKANVQLGSSSLSGDAGSDNLSAGPGNDTLVGCASGANGGRNEIDTLSGGLGNDIFQLGWAGGRFHDDGNATNPGRADYALITDFTVGQDKLQLDGAKTNYLLGASGVANVAGSGLFHDTNANAKLDSTDELIAILRSANSTSLTPANTINPGIFV